MRAPANPPAKPLGRLALTFVALMLATVSMTTPAKADEPSGAADGESAVVADVAGESSDSASDAGHPEPSGAPTLAGYLASGMLRVSADVELVDGDEAIEPVVGSFTVDGLTYAIVGEGQVALVAVSPRTLAGGLVGGSDVAPDGDVAGSPAGAPSGEDSGSGVPTSPSPSPEGASSDDAEGDALVLPESVSYGGSGYSLAAIGPRALAGCEAGTVVIPASAASVDQAAFEGSPIASVEVAEGNPEYSSYDGMLFDADMTRLLLIPEGKQGAARVPETAQEVDAHALSHSGGVSAFSVDAGSAAFHSENGSLYDSGDNLLWAPPGSEEAASLASGGPEGAGDAPDGSDGAPPAASLGEAASARSATDITVTCATDKWVWYDKPQGAKDEFRQSYGAGVSHKMSRGACTKVRLIPMSSSLKGTYGVAGHYVTTAGNPTVDASAWRWYVHSGASDSAMTVETGAAIVWADGRRERMLVGETYLTQPGMRIELHRGVDVKVTLWGKDGSDSSKIDDVYAVSGQAMPSVAPPTRAGYRFMGYYTGTGTRYYDASGKSDKAMSQKTELRLFARWVPEVRVFANGHRLEWFKRVTEDNYGSTSTPASGSIDGAEYLSLAAEGWHSPVAHGMTIDEVRASSSRPHGEYHDVYAGTAGWSVVGWKWGPAGSTASTATNDVVTNNGKWYSGGAWLFPVWKANIYKVTLDKQGGSGGTDRFWLKYGHWASLTEGGPDDANPLPSLPTRAGYSFAGYFTEPDGRGRQDVGADGRLLILNTAYASDTTLYALWQPNVYKVTLDKTGGSGGTDAFWLKYAHYASLTEGGPDNCNPLPSLPTRAGYRFAGYFTEPGDRGRQDIGADGRLLILNTAYTSNVTLYAHWAPLTLTYQPGSGVATVANAYERAFDASGAGHDRLVGSSSFEGAKGFQAWALWTDSRNFQVFTLPDGNPQHFQHLVPSRAGHRLVGWALNGARLEEGKFALIHGAATLEPIWEPGIYKVALDKQGGSGGTDAFWLKYAHWASLTEGGPDNCNPLPSLPTRAGYRFAGYFTEREGKGSMHVGPDGSLRMLNTAYTSNVTLYAHWTINPVTVHANGHELSWSWEWREGWSAPVTKTDSGKLAADGSHTVESTRYYGTNGEPLCVDEIVPYSWFLFRGAAPGWTCIGFNTDPKASAGLPSAAYTNSADLYAIWKANVYEVALDKQGGTGGTDRFWLKYGHWASLTEGGPDDANPLPSLPTRTGYSFAGYYTEPGGKGSCHIAADGRLLMGNTAYASNATLYARWEAVPYGISYDCAGGELHEGARGSYFIEDAFDLPVPARYGYQFDGWDVSGVAEDGSAGPVLGSGVEDATAEDGSKVTRVKAGTYGDLSCTARWTLRYDLDVPVCDPGSVTFEADSLTGQVRVAPGTSAEGAILSYMAVPVALDSLSCEGLDSSGAVDPAGGAPELEAIFGAGSASKVRFAATLGEGDAARTAKLTAGGSSAIASLAGLAIPAAASHDAPGRIPVSYGLELDSDLPIPPVRDAAPVARLAYTVSLAGAGA